MSKAYYLIDFENVKSEGISGIADLTMDDEVFLFYTRNANKINIDLLELLRNVETNFHTVAVAGGKQALDNQLDSYLGYLIGINGADAVYNIISKDKGFHIMKSFWSDYTINLKTSIGSDKKKEPAEAETNATSTAEKSTGKAKSGSGRHFRPDSTKQPASDSDAKPIDKAVINTEIQKELSKSKLDADITNSVASITSKNLLQKNGKQLIYREIIKKYGQKQGLEIYNLVKAKIHELLK